MTIKKTRRLSCIVTGKVLIATREYYDRKLKNFKNEQEMHDTYICKEAKNLLTKGYTVDKIRDMLNVSKELPPVPQQVLDSLGSDKPTLKTINNNNTPISMVINPKTDPEVKQFIQHIIRNESK